MKLNHVNLKYYLITCSILILAIWHLDAQEVGPLLVVEERINTATNQYYVYSENCFSYRQDGKLIVENGIIKDKTGINIRKTNAFYEYDKHGNKVVDFKGFQVLATGISDTSSYDRKSYNDNNKLITEIDWVSKNYRDSVIYSIDENNCYSNIIRYEFDPYNNNGLRKFVKYSETEFQRGPACQIVTTRQEFYRFNLLYENRYEYNEMGFLISHLRYRWNFETSDWELSEERIYEVDEMGRRTTQAITSFRSGGNALSRFEYDYDGDNPFFIRSFKERYDSGTDQWLPSSIESYIYNPEGERIWAGYSWWRYSFGKTTFDDKRIEYEYDADGNLITKTDFHVITVDDEITVNNVYTTSYEYRCDGQKLEEITEQTEDFGGRQRADYRYANRKTYTYGKPAPCESQLEIFEIQVYPNPASQNSTITIGSELLFFAGSTVSLNMADGNILKTFQPDIGKEFSFELSVLQSGVYLVIVENQDLGQRLIEKILVL